MEPGPRFRRRTLWKHGLLTAAFIVSLLTLVWAADLQPAGKDLVELDDVHAEVRTGESLAYEIDAAKGFYSTDSRTVTMEGPRVRIYDRQGQLKDRVQGREGRMWPVAAVVTQEDGTVVVVTQYNWSIRGDVLFQSEQGYRLKTTELFFDHQTSEIRSESGIEYVIPTGRGGVFEGTANEFRSVMGEDSSLPQNWILTGAVQLTMREEK
jgi:hypothetical protein